MHIKLTCIFLVILICIFLFFLSKNGNSNIWSYDVDNKYFGVNNFLKLLLLLLYIQNVIVKISKLVTLKKIYVNRIYKKSIV